MRFVHIILAFYFINIAFSRPIIDCADLDPADEIIDVNDTDNVFGDDEDELNDHRAHDDPDECHTDVNDERLMKEFSDRFFDGLSSIDVAKPVLGMALDQLNSDKTYEGRYTKSYEQVRLLVDTLVGKDNLPDPEQKKRMRA